MNRILLVGLLVASALVSSGQAVVDGFSIDQVNFAGTNTGNVPCSEYGQAGFAVRQVPGVVQYIQVVAQLAGSTTAPAWIVRNVPAMAAVLSETTQVNLTLLGVRRGTCIVGSKVTYTITVTNNLIAAAPGYSGSLTAFMGQITQRAEGVQTNNPAPPSLPPPDLPAAITLALRAVSADAAPGLGDLQFRATLRPGMGNVIQNKNECVPSAIVNSMHWLDSTRAIDLKGETPEQSLAKLKADTGWNVDTGSTPTKMIEGKLKFSQRAEHPLDLDIHYQTWNAFSLVGESVTSGTGVAKRDGPDGPPTLEFIKQEMEKGQDVELTLRWLGQNAAGTWEVKGGHAMAISGVVTAPGVNGLLTNDDAAQDGKGSKLRTNHWNNLQTLQVNGKPAINLSNETLNFVDTVYSESPKPRYALFMPLEEPSGLAEWTLEGPMSQSPGRPALIRTALGSPTQIPGSPFAAGPQTVAAATALGKFVYAVNYGSNNMTAYRINPATGALTTITGSPYAVGANPFAVATDPSGRLLYVANYGGGTISAFTIDPITGVLTPVVGAPYPTNQAPSGLAVSPSGRLLFASTASGFVHAYVIDPPTGGLTQVAGSPFAAGINPRAVAVDPSGQFVYTANAGSSPTNGGVAAFRIGQTGALTAVAGSPFQAGSQPSYLAIDSTGRFAYVSNFASNNVSAFTINQSTGALAQVPGSPYTVPAGPFGIGVEPLGQTVYVASQGTNPGFISAFSINSTSGALTPLSGSPFPGGGGPARMAFAAISPVVGTYPAPTLTQLAPSGAKPGAGVTVVSVYGTNFVPASVVRWNGVARHTEFESSTLLNVAIPANDLAQAGTATITVANPTPGGGTSSPLNFTINASLALPGVTGEGTLNDAGFTIGQAVAPGSIAASFGTALAIGTSALTSPPSNTVLGSSMKIDGGAAPYFFVSAGQVVFQVPWELAGQQRALATFTTAAGTSSPATIPLAEYAPGIFTMNAAGVGAIVINSTGELTAAAGTVPGIANRPAPRGDYIAIYCTGLGDVANRPATGVAASLTTLSPTVANASVTIGGVAAAPYFAGLAPGYVGLYQVVVQVPANTPTGNAVPLTISIGGQTSNTVTLAVQ